MLRRTDILGVPVSAVDMEGAAAVYCVVAAPSYPAQAPLQLDPKLPPIFREASDLGLALGTGQIETHMVVLHSRTIAAAVVDRLGLWQDPEFQRPPGLGLLARITGRIACPLADRG